MSVCEIVYRTRTVRKPLTNGKSVEVSKQMVTLNGIKLFEINSDEYALSKQETTDKSLEFIANLRLALQSANIPITFRQGEY